MDQQPSVEPRFPRSNVYTFDGQMLIIASIAAVFVFIVLLITLHLYARWWLRNGPGSGLTHIFVVTDDHPPSASDHGLETDVLSSLPVFTHSSSAEVRLECAVCLSEFEVNEIGRLLPKCNHSFHIECIDMWFHSHSTCPLCRSLVEAVVEVDEETSRPEPSSASDSGLCDKCKHEESSMSRMLSFKRLGAVSRTPQSSELDLEGGLGEVVRVSTPK